MLVGPMLVLSLFGGHGHQADAISTNVLRPAGWSVKVQRDGFTGKVSCELSKAKITTSPGWVVLHLGRRVGTEVADVRIDNGPARDVHDIPRPLYDPTGTAKDPILNPSGGRVVLPMAELMNARLVLVRPHPNERIARFDVTGLSQALQAAAGAGCPGESIPPANRP